MGIFHVQIINRNVVTRVVRYRGGTEKIKILLMTSPYYKLYYYIIYYTVWKHTEIYALIGLGPMSQSVLVNLLFESKKITFQSRVISSCNSYHTVRIVQF